MSDPIEFSRLRLGDLSDAVRELSKTWGCTVTQVVHRLLRLGLAAAYESQANAAPSVPVSVDAGTYVKVCIAFKGGPWDGRAAIMGIPRVMFAGGSFELTIDHGEGKASPYEIVDGPVLEAIVRTLQDDDNAEVPSSLSLLALFKGA